MDINRTTFLCFYISLCAIALSCLLSILCVYEETHELKSIIIEHYSQQEEQPIKEDDDNKIEFNDIIYDVYKV